MVSKPLNLTKKMEQVLLGSLLGDGSLHIHKKRGKNATYTEEHSLKQLQYAKWKNSFLKFKETLVNRKEKRFGDVREYQQVCIYSPASPTLTEYYSFFYPNGKKVVTREILDKLEPLGLAVWYCDDGCYLYRQNMINFATNKFTKKENEFIIDFFYKKFHIKSRLRKLKKEQFNIEPVFLGETNIGAYNDGSRFPENFHHTIGIFKSKE